MNDDSAVAKPAVTTTGTAKTKPVNPDAPSVIKKSGVPATEAASAAQTASGSETTSATQPTSDVGATGATSPTSGTGAASVTSTDNVAASADSDTGAAGAATEAKVEQVASEVKAAAKADVAKTDQKVDEPTPETSAAIKEINEKLTESQNILIALSSNPSVDELAGAIGLSLFLDRTGKRPTAIYSGETPNALQFLKPEETFESNTDALQDFVIALNKEKADHLRYKLDGDYVKIFITPYRTRIDKDDLEFSYGDFNVDLIFALNVANGGDLDNALREHGRIMHDATIIDVTTGEPGKLGEIEWNDATASSVSEMLAKLAYETGGGQVEKEEATAFLTGVIAATGRFSNNKTTPETLRLAAKLVSSGANPELVAKNITPEASSVINAAVKSSEGETAEAGETTEVATEAKAEDTVVEVPLKGASSEAATSKTEAKTDEAGTVETETANETTTEATTTAGEAVETAKTEAVATAEVVKTDTVSSTTANASTTNNIVSASEDFAKLEMNGPFPGDTAPVAENTSDGTNVGATVDTAGGTNASATSESASAVEPTNPALLNDLKAAADTLSHAASETIPDPSKPPVSLEDIQEASEPPAGVTEPAVAEAAIQTTVEIPTGANVNPAAAMAPAVPDKPEINGVPEINYTPPADAEILPPPPAPPVDLNNAAATPPTEVSAVTPPVANAGVGNTAGPVVGGATAPLGQETTAGVATASPIAPGVAPVGTLASAPVEASTATPGSAASADPTAQNPATLADPAAPSSAASADPAAFKIPGM